MKMSRYSDASEHLRKLLGFDENDNLLPGALLPADAPELRAELAHAEDASLKYDLAEKSYKEAIHGNPTKIEDYVRLAQLYRKQEHDPKADEIMDQLVKDNSDSFRAHWRPDSTGVRTSFLRPTTNWPWP